MEKPKIRVSSLPQLLSCGGSRTLKALVRQREGGEGFEGSYVHWAGAARIIAELGAEAPEGGLPAATVPAGYRLPRPAEWMIGWWFNHVQHAYPQDWALAVELEQEFEFDRFILVGHQDVHGVNRDATSCKGSDLKTGTKPVAPAAENDQCLGYLCQNALAYPSLDYNAFEICQPRLSEDDGLQRVSLVELDKSGIQRCLSSLNDRVNAALDNPYLIQSGILQCAFCDAMLQCPAIRADYELMKMLLTPEMLAQIKTDPDDATLGDIAIAAKVLANPFDAAKDAIKARIASTGGVTASDGTRITAKVTGGAYKVIDAPGLYAAIKETIKDDARLAGALSFPLGRLTDAVAEEMGIPAGGKKPVTAEKVTDARFKPFMEQGQKTTLMFN